MDNSIKYIKFAEYLNGIESPEHIARIAVKEYACSIEEIDGLIKEFKLLITNSEPDRIVKAFATGIKLQTLLDKQIQVLNVILEHTSCKSHFYETVNTADLVSLNVYFAEIKRHLDEAIQPLHDKLVVSLDDYTLNMGCEYDPVNEEDSELQLM